MDYASLRLVTSKYLPTAACEEIKKAWQYAKARHAGQKRKSGEDYIIHPLSAAVILAKMKLDKETIMAALLHDVPEDTNTPLEEIKEKFGETVALLVAGVTKLGHVRLRSEEERQAQNLRKMMLAVANDARVILIKLADRLHNMQTIAFVADSKKKGIARETLEIYAPLAHRLGLQEIKSKLEDLSFEVLEPEKWQAIKKEVMEKKVKSKNYLAKIKRILEKKLKEEKIPAGIYIRTKNFYSIYRNVYIEHKDPSVEKVLDIYGIRIVVGTIPECYLVLGLVHKLWRPIANRLKDYIAMPKSNGYQSLHTGVICEEGKVVEIQIRTREMHEVAEFGLAAHWQYKAKENIKEQDKKKLAWIAELLEWQKEIKSDEEFLKSFKLDLYQNEIFVFTPKGDVRNLPENATPIDFAYTIHTDLINHIIGAKVNGRLVALHHPLKSGDVVEIVTSAAATGPSRAWLQFVKTAAARSGIKKFITRQDELLKEQKKLKKPSLTEEEEPEKEEKRPFVPKQTANRLSVLIAKQEHLAYHFASCCHPEKNPTQAIAGYITRGRGVTIHNQNCPIFEQLFKKEKQRIIEAEWASRVVNFFRTSLNIITWNRTGVLKDIAEVFADLAINISSVKSQKIGENKNLVQIGLEITDYSNFSLALSRLSSIPDVLSVKRR